MHIIEDSCGTNVIAVKSVSEMKNSEEKSNILIKNYFPVLPVLI